MGSVFLRAREPGRQRSIENQHSSAAKWKVFSRHHVVDLTDPATSEELDTYVPLIQQGRGGEVLGV